jgi:site-specific recombinase XerD
MLPIITNNSLSSLTSLNELIEAFLSSKDIGDKSKDAYRTSLKAFTAWYALQGCPAMDEALIVSYKRTVEQSELSKNTVAAYIIILRSFFKWTEEKGLCPNLAKGLRTPKRLNGFRKDPLSLNQIKQLLESIDVTTIAGKRDYAILNLCIRVGLRAIEITRLDCKDIRVVSTGETVLDVWGKNHSAKDDFCVLTPDALKPIEDYLAARGTVSDDSPIFVSHSNQNDGGRLTTRSVSRIAKEALKKISICSDRLTLHSFRHTCVSLAIQSGCSILEAKTLARHQSCDTTLLYARQHQRVENAPEYKIDQLLKAG